MSGTRDARERGGTIYVQQAADGTTYVASVVELPGAFARGATREEAIERVRVAYRAYVDLLGARGVNVDHWKDRDPATFAVKDPPARFTYPEDFGRALTEHEIRDFLHQLEASRSALLTLVRGLSPSELERKPMESMWSVREALEHIAFTEVGLLAKLERWPEREFATLQAVHRMVFQRFTVMEPDDTVDHEVWGTRWGTRKVMRRILEHEHEHYGHIKEIIVALAASERAPE